MRMAILAIVLAIVVAVAQPAGAVDHGFRGWYRVNGRTWCPGADRDRVLVLYLSETRRYLAHAGFVWSGRLRYMLGRRFPWQTTNNGPFSYELRYDPATDTAVGFKYGLEGRTCRVRLVPID